MTPVDQEIARLVMEYQETLRGGKDRDCHWSIAKCWSYGEFKGYVVEHDGYIYDLDEGQYGESRLCETYGEAAQLLVSELKKAIRYAQGVFW